MSTDPENEDTPRLELIPRLLEALDPLVQGSVALGHDDGFIAEQAAQHMSTLMGNSLGDFRELVAEMALVKWQRANPETPADNSERCQIEVAKIAMDIEASVRRRS